METALFAKVQSQIQNTGVILDHIQDTRMMPRRHEEAPPLITQEIEASARTTNLLHIHTTAVAAAHTPISQPQPSGPGAFWLLLAIKSSIFNNIEATSVADFMICSSTARGSSTSCLNISACPVAIIG
jgi:hypothetical protein